MKALWQAATILGVLALVLGVVEHFVILAQGEGVMFIVATPEAFVQVSMTLFLFAIVILLAGIAGRLALHRSEEV
ncbi:MAG TPA: hypothetical protein DGT21_10775 [Armatimonadetes bacterium]|nr:hypothetical protein [Armatimonadota bacterium]